VATPISRPLLPGNSHLTETTRIVLGSTGDLP
jgi:hypothetical protein